MLKLESNISQGFHFLNISKKALLLWIFRRNSMRKKYVGKRKSNCMIFKKINYRRKTGFEKETFLIPGPQIMGQNEGFSLQLHSRMIWEHLKNTDIRDPPQTSQHVCGCGLSNSTCESSPEVYKRTARVDNYCSKLAILNRQLCFLKLFTPASFLPSFPKYPARILGKGEQAGERL